MSEDDEDFDEQSVKRWKNRFGCQTASQGPIFNHAKIRRGLPSTAPQRHRGAHKKRFSTSINSKWLADTQSELKKPGLNPSSCLSTTPVIDYGVSRVQEEAGQSDTSNTMISVSEPLPCYNDIGGGDVDSHGSPVVAGLEKSIGRSTISVPECDWHPLECKQSYSDTDHGTSRCSQEEVQVVGEWKLSNAQRQASLKPFLSGHSSKSDTATSNPFIAMRSLPQSHIGASSSNGQQCIKSAQLLPTPRLETTANGRRCKTCPFYKKVPGSSFVVDAFQYGSIPGCSAYFLSHFHSDHYQGLRKSFKHPIYCSQVTANLVRHCLKVPGEYVHALPLNKTSIVEGVEVTLLEANHCPGSVMFLFKLSSGENHLHTGDFRFYEGMKEYPQLAGCSIQHLFLDTTYCSPQYGFPHQDDVIGFAVEKVVGAIKCNPKTLIVCGTYTIGKEKVFLAIAEAIGSKVCVSQDKKAILDCLDSERVAKIVTTDPGMASVHVLPMGRLATESLVDYLEKWKPWYTSLLAFRPTGWTYSSKYIGLGSIRPLCKGAVTVYGIPYSEHCSFTELREFVQFLRPKKVIPTVGSDRNYKEMERYFQKWLSGGTETKTVQTTLDLTFTFNKGR